MINIYWYRAAICFLICFYFPALVNATIERRGVPDHSEYDINRIENLSSTEQVGDYQAFNRSQNIVSKFDNRGVHLRPNTKDESVWHLTLSLVGFGHSGAVQPLNFTRDSPAHVAGNRIEFTRDGLTEWYENTEKGLEHGITIFTPPVRSKGEASSLVIEMQLTGSLVPRLRRNAKSLTLYDKNDSAVLQYDGLKVWDSRDRILSAELRVTVGKGDDHSYRVAIAVDDSQAVYPITIDPIFSYAKKFERLEWAWMNGFGYSVAINGDTILVGSPLGSKDNVGSVGTAYIYYPNLNGDLWGQSKKLSASNGISVDNFGYSVAIDDDTAVVCSNDYLWTDGGTKQAYIYYRNQGGIDNWGEVKIISMGSTTRFGDSVAINGDTLVVGDGRAYTNGLSTGAAYVYGRNQGGPDAWGLVKKIVSNDASDQDNFGYSVSIDGDTIAVGAYRDDDSGSNCGSVYMFERNNSGADNWGQLKKILSSDSAAEDQFGWGVAIKGDILVVGSPYDDDDGNSSGAAHVFQRNFGGADNWGQFRKLTASNAEEEARFGASVSIDGDSIIVGAPGANIFGSKGAAYVFERNAGGLDNWGEFKILYSSTGATLGRAVGISTDTVVIGDYWNRDNGFWGGAAFVHERDHGGADNWGEVKELLPLAVAELPGNHFGKSVDIDEDIAVVGAYSGRDIFGSNFGIAYIFERDHLGINSWGQFKILQAGSEGAYGDNFGWSVRVSENLVLVGAPYDDDNGSNSGSAYIFDRYYDGGNDDWGYDRVKKLLASDGAASDYFGYSVDISGGIAVVAAYRDDDNGTDSGSVYIYERDAGGTDKWGEVKKITSFDGIASDYFGFSVAASGSIIAVGAYGDDDKGSSSGSVYIYERNTDGPGAWGLMNKVNAPDGAASDYFGYAVSLSGSMLLVGAYGDDDKGSGSGSAYIFEKNAGGINNWGFVKKLLAIDGTSGDSFGHAVNISNDRAVVGAYYDDNGATNSGSAYVFLRNEGGSINWGQVDKLTAEDPMASSYFGDAVAIFGDTVIAGAYMHDDFGSDSGAAYVYAISADDCVGDFDTDGDIDGADLRSFAVNNQGIAYQDFALNFGKADCPH